MKQLFLILCVTCIVFVACKEKVKPPEVLSVVPNVGYYVEDTPITIHGKHFYVNAEVDLNKKGSVPVQDEFSVRMGEVELSEVQFIDARTLTAVVPHTLPPDVYDLSVIAPSGKTGTLEDAFTMVAMLPVSVISVEPSAGVNDESIDIMVNGTNFSTGTQVFLSEHDLVVKELAKTSMVVTIPALLDPGFYDIHVKKADGHEATLESGFKVVTKAVLEASLQMDPTHADLGEVVVVRLSVQNTGGSAAEGVMPSALTWTPGEAIGEVELISGPSPEQTDIQPSEQIDFEWEYRTIAPGEGAFSVAAAGDNQYSGKTVSTGTIESLSLPIDIPTTLSVSLEATPSTASTNQDISLRMTVFNGSGALATDVAPESVLPDQPDCVVLVSSPSGDRDIPVDETVDFFWTYVAVDSCVLSFSGMAQGTSTITGARIESTPGTSNTADVKLAAALSIVSFAASPQTATAGQDIQLTYNIRNTGEVSAKYVAPIVPLAMGSSATPNTTSPTPSSATIAAGAQVPFDWYYTATSAGNLTFSGRAAGKDLVSGLEIFSDYADSNTVSVLEPPKLLTTLSVDRTVLSEGQSIVITMDISNTGGVAAVNVVPSALTVSETGHATLSSGPTPAHPLRRSVLAL